MRSGQSVHGTGPEEAGRRSFWEWFTVQNAVLTVLYDSRHHDWHYQDMANMHADVQLAAGMLRMSLKATLQTATDRGQGSSDALY